MLRPTPPGTPFPLTPAPIEQVISTFGDMAACDGGTIRLANHCLVFAVKLGDAECEVGIGLAELLESIQAYNKRTES